MKCVGPITRISTREVDIDDTTRRASNQAKPPRKRWNPHIVFSFNANNCTQRHETVDLKFEDGFVFLRSIKYTLIVLTDKTWHP